MPRDAVMLEGELEKGAEDTSPLVWQQATAYGKQHAWRCNNPMAVLRWKVISGFACD